MKMIEDIIRGIGSALTAAAPGIGSLTAGLLKLTDSFVNGGALSGLTSWFNEAMASFSQWISKMQATGQLDAIFQSLGAVLKVVMDTLGAIAQIGLDTLTDPEAMLAFMAILKGVGAALVFFFAASKSFLNAVGVLAINAALFFGQLAATITSVVTAIAGFAVQLASKFQTAWATLVQYAVAAWNGVVNAVSSAVATIVGIVSSVGSTISGIWNGITAAASGAWNGVVSAISAAWAAIVSTIQGAISTVLGIVSGWGSSIIGVITSIDLAGAGRALIQRFIDGVKGMAGAVVGAVKSVFGGIMSLIPRSPAKDGPFAQSGWNNLRLGGQAVAQQFGDGMTNGFEGVLGEAKSMAGKIADVFSSGGDPTGLLSGLDNKQVNTMEKTLSFEAKRLGLQAKALDYQSKTTGNAALKARADEIRAQQEQITMQKEMLDLTQEYADLQNPGSGARSDNPFLASIQELMKLPSGFGSATANQAMQDLNISGDGALQAIAGFGMDFAKKGVTNIFNTSNVDDTLALHFNQTNRQAQGVVGR
jgi:phage-related protein